jgi:GST-like protein
MYVLFGTPASGSAIAEAGLEMAGAAYRVKHASSWEAGSARDELKRINPLQQIPTLLLPDGSVLTESAAILIHLGLEFPRSGILPGDAGLRAQALRGLVYIAANCYSAVGVTDFPERWCEPIDKSARERILRGSRAQLHRYWDHFAAVFASPPKGAFLLGQTPCGLDVMASIVSKWSGTRAHLRQHQPALLALIDRIEEHPSVAAVFERHWPPAGR